jgi:phage tail sheath protein FI
MATPQLSPGVLIREVDLTVGRIDNIIDNIGAIAGPFVKGPVEDPITIETEDELLKVFGPPVSSDNQYEYWLTASSFLSYGGILKVVRTDSDVIVNSSTRTQFVGEVASITSGDDITVGAAITVVSGRADDARTYVSQTFVLGEIGAGNTTGYGYTTSSAGSGLIISVGLGTTGSVEALSIINNGEGYSAGDSLFINDIIFGNPAGDTPVQLKISAGAVATEQVENIIADEELKIKNDADYEGQQEDVGVAYLYAGKNPGTWSNGLAVAFIDDLGDQILDLTDSGATVSNIQVGYGVTVTLDQVRRPVRRTGRNDEGGGFFTEDGFLKGIVTGVSTDTSEVVVRVVSKVALDGSETPVEYKNRSRHSSFKPNTQIAFVDENGSVIETANILQGSKVKDWYNEQFISLETGNILWKAIAQKPSTNQWVAERKGRNDALHLAVFDDLGTVTGIKGNLLEKFVSLSKAKDAISAINPPQRVYWKDYVAQNSAYIFVGDNPSDISNQERTYSSGFDLGTSVAGFGNLTPVSQADGLWNVSGKERVFSVLGSKLYRLSGGKDYTPVLSTTTAAAASPTAALTIAQTQNASTVTLTETVTIGSFKASLGDLLNAYDYFADEDEIALDYLLMGPGLENKEESQAKAQNLIAIANERRDCIACISPHRGDVVPDGFSFKSTDDMTDDVVEFFSTLASSSYAVFDSGYKYMYDRFNDAFRYIPCNGDIAGLMVRTSIDRYPWFSPAGQQRGIINNAVKLAYNPTKAQRDRLYVARVNPVITQSGLGTLLFGDKTALGYASAFDRINVRRLFLYVEQSLKSLADAQLFELNDEITRSNFVSVVEPFLADIQAKRGLYGYLVVCDETNNTPDIIDNNEFRADIYLQPTKSINYVTLTFVATRTGISFGEITGTV